MSQAATNGWGVVRSPKPYTTKPASRMRVARRVKSLSDETPGAYRRSRGATREVLPYAVADGLNPSPHGTAWR